MIIHKQFTIWLYFDGDFDGDFPQKDLLIEEVRASSPLFLEQLETRFYRCFYTLDKNMESQLPTLIAILEKYGIKSTGENRYSFSERGEYEKSDFDSATFFGFETKCFLKKRQISIMILLFLIEEM
jgi:hypothetical protein